MKSIDKAEVLLETKLEVAGKVKIIDFVDFMQKKLGVSNPTAWKYWFQLSIMEQFDNDLVYVWRA